ncbi:MAG TPA: CoA transferase [Streptosporangiaceae bacterium]|nr:CoA transferase [Streptosporangiaceae bacterium]
MGPRAALPGNDALMQAVTGFERAVGGAGNEPLAATWIPIDMAGGWVAAGTDEQRRRHLPAILDGEIWV